eukprot:CAMPEP_0182445444 /NCGR_PEP_ID=MMETSP1172-20130603/3564_1 /TAXON_ID=708627 /ORGANISM="Timspurckia oligopyrenoides, Strain CCMP3278" /LENGTH=149 /DNA_ID=CAMNT_0024641217 /DNA_START=959 /DNA_END=1409 /DNA_ORIENTATION=-
MKKCIFVLLMLFGFLLVVTLAAPVTESEKLDENQGSLMIRQDEEEPMELEELDDEEDVLDDEETLEDDMERYPRYGGYGKRHGGYGYGGKYRDLDMEAMESIEDINMDMVIITDDMASIMVDMASIMVVTGNTMDTSVITRACEVSVYV